MPKKQPEESQAGILVNTARAVGATLGKLAAKVKSVRGGKATSVPAPAPARKRKPAARKKPKSVRKGAKSTKAPTESPS